MKKSNTKHFILLIIIISILNCKVYASETLDSLNTKALNDEYIEYLQEPNNSKYVEYIPTPYKIEQSSSQLTNPLKYSRILGASSSTKFNLKDIIPENVIVKNQYNQSTCWAFSTLSSLETNLAIKDYYICTRNTNL